MKTLTKREDFVSTGLSKNMNERLDKKCERLGMSRAEYLRGLIISDLEEVSENE